jgi:hypothetical protein
MGGKPHASQLQLDIFEPPPSYKPFDCPHELKTVDIGGGKSLCALMDAWTNCREVGHCVHAVIRG